MSTKFVISKSKSDKFLFNLKAGNGESSDQPDVRRQVQCDDGIESVKANAPLDERYERKASTKGEPFFNLKAANGLVIGHSEMYSSSSAMEGGIASVKKNAPAAAIDDQVS